MTTNPALILGLRVNLRRRLDLACGHPLSGIKTRCEAVDAVVYENLILTGADGAAALRCSKCGRHRGWLPAAAVQGWTDVAAVFGRPEEVTLYDNIGSPDERRYP